MKKTALYILGVFLFLAIGAGLGSIVATSQSSTSYETEASEQIADTASSTDKPGQNETKSDVNSNIPQAATSSDVSSDLPQATGTTSSSPEPEENPPAPAEPTVTFENMNLQADGVLVLNAATGNVLHEKNADKERPLASITKLMTALVAREKAGNFSSDTVTISDAHLRALGDNNLSAGSTWRLADLTRFMLMESSNDAARAVAAANAENPADGYAEGFVDAMNQTADNIGLETTYFFNPSGLDINEDLISGGYGSARDVAQLFQTFYERYPGLLAATTQSQAAFETTRGQQFIGYNTNPLVSQLPNIIGSKTGYTVLAGGNLVMGFSGFENPIIISLLGSTKSGRFADMRKAYEASENYFNGQDS